MADSASPEGRSPGAARISVSPLGGREFQVDVRDRGQQTTHRVSVPERVGGVEVTGDGAERAVRESFEFLLERESPTSILRQFSLGDISRYFPEYPQELARRLS
jgi:hypothetical protein